MTELERLQGIVDKLPISTDGVPVIAGGIQHVWIVEAGYEYVDSEECLDRGYIYRCLVLTHGDDNWCLEIGGAYHEDPLYWFGPVYSTRKAAEAAKRKGHGNAETNPA